MLSKCLDSLINLDTDTAYRVCEADDAVDAIHLQMYEKTELRIKENPAQVRSAIQIMEVSHQLERIADLTTNIAEDVIYMVDGKIIRHRGMSDMVRPPKKKKIPADQ